MKYSVVIPLKDEEENIAPLFAELKEVMNKTASSWEVLFVDDGSTDKTAEVLAALQKEHTQVRVLTFEKNFGQTSAFDAGFKRARGEVLITMDGDCQNNPADIPVLLECLQTCDLVCGERKARKDTFIKRATSTLARKVRHVVLKDPIRDTGCSLKVYRTKALRSVPLFDGMHRFLPALFIIYGYRVDQMAVDHRPRAKGTSKYNFLNRSFNTISDLLAVLWMSKRALKYKVKHST